MPNRPATPSDSVDGINLHLLYERHAARLPRDLREVAYILWSSGFQCGIAFREACPDLVGDLTEQSIGAAVDEAASRVPPAPGAEDAVRVLRGVFGHRSFREGQRETLQTLFEGRSAMFVMPPGHGKSLCYQVAAVLLDGLTVVVSPLVSLMKDQVDALRRRRVPADYLHADNNPQETVAIFEAIRMGALKILFVTPERLVSDRLLRVLRSARVALLAVDEAHCVSDLGCNFRPDYLRLLVAVTEVRPERLLAVTATATPEVIEDAATSFGIDFDDVRIGGVFLPNHSLEFAGAAGRDRDQRLLELPFDRPTIIYVRSSRAADRLRDLLAENGTAAESYYGAMDWRRREAVQERFMRDRAPVVVATMAFGMGIDRSDVGLVVHYGLPKGVEEWLQQIGRAGRNGAPAQCVLFAGEGDLRPAINLVQAETPTAEALRECVERLAGAGADGISVAEAAGDHDISAVSVRTVAAWLEKMGLLVQHRQSCRLLRFRPLVSEQELRDPEISEPGFYDALIRNSQADGEWRTVSRRRLSETGTDGLTETLERLAAARLIDLDEADSRLFVEPCGPISSASADRIVEMFAAAEVRAVTRVRDMAALVGHTGCHWMLVVERFGGRLLRPCGRCSYCRTGRPVSLPAAPPSPPWPSSSLVENLRAAHRPLRRHDVMTRFLCGISSPVINRERFQDSDHFGKLRDAEWDAVLHWVSSVT